MASILTTTTITTRTTTDLSCSSFDTKNHDGKPLPKVTAVSVDEGCPRRRRGIWRAWSTARCTTGETKPAKISTKPTAFADPNQDQKRGWKPLSMTTPILASIILLTLLIAASIELLAQQSQRKGGLALSPSLAEMPNHAKWAYLYGPNVVAVLYSLLWSWVDLDVKRMQPWLELSRPDGATAEDSLFLDYPFDFVALAPWKAARKGHWMVALAGTAMMLVFWGITPLQSAVLGTGVVVTTYAAPIAARGELIPMEEQARTLNGEVSNQAFAVAWLNQSMPEFQAMDYAYAPFKVDESGPVLPGTNWTAATTRYSTELTCWSATFEESPYGPQYWTNGRNCSWYPMYSPQESSYTMMYFGYHETTWDPVTFDGPYCPWNPDVEHQFVAMWAPPGQLTDSAGILQATALFCQPEYFKQKVLLTVDASTRLPIPGFTKSISVKEILTEAEFNRTAFETFISTGTTGVEYTADAPFADPVDQVVRIMTKYDVQDDVNNMVGFALGLETLSIQELGQEEALRAAYSRTHKYIFSLAINHLSKFTKTIDANDSVDVTISRTGIVVSRAFATATEAVLAVVAVLTTTLLWLSYSAESNLDCNPSSIARLGRLLGKEPRLVELFCAVDNRDEKSLAKKFQSVRLALRVVERGGRLQSHLEMIDEGPKSEVQDEEEMEERDPFYRAIRPLALRKASGVAFATSIAAAAVVLAYFKVEERRSRGIERPKTSFEILQFLENVVPTVFATLTEPFWVLLTRLLCMLQPFHDLSRGRADPGRTIETTYLAVPPQIVMLRAFKSRHFLLLLTCLMAFLGNFLAVGLGALFNEESIMLYKDGGFEPKFAARFDNTSLTKFVDIKTVEEQQQIVLANLSAGTPLLPWSTAEYFFRPFDLPSLSRSHNAEGYYSVQSRGFGARGNCTSFGERRIPVDDSSAREILEKQDEKGRFVECPDLVDAHVYDMQKNWEAVVETGIEKRESGRCAWEHIRTRLRTDGLDCGNFLLAGFGRTNNGSALRPSINASFAVCHPYFETRVFNLTVNSKGHVLTAVPAGEIERTLDYPDADDHESRILKKATAVIGTGGGNIWHNGSVSKSWFAHLMVEAMGSRKFLDPLEPVPDASTLVPVMDNVYRRLFAAMLSQYPSIFDKDDEMQKVVGQIGEEEVRIFMDTPALIISMVVLGLNLAVAIAFYVQMSRSLLPRMPSSIGSILAYVAPSRTLGCTEDTKDEDAANVQAYGFGRFIGKDGHAHIGIEKDQYVVPIDIRSLDGGRSFWQGMLRNRKDRAKRVGPWL